jgi:hypothetical protein
VKVKVRDKVYDLPPFVAENCPDIGMMIGRNWLDVLMLVGWRLFIVIYEQIVPNFDKFHHYK